MVPQGTCFSVDQVERKNDSVHGRIKAESGSTVANGFWTVLFDSQQLQISELIVEGFNEKPRKPIKGQSGHQMMLVSDMVLLWDQGFRQHLEVYAKDEDALKQDFGDAFRRLTELGCPWSKDQCPVTGAVGTGCPA